MSKFFNRRRFGEPQFIAAILLLAFLAQCTWLVAIDLRSGQPHPTERLVLQQGLDRWHGREPAPGSAVKFLSDGEAADSGSEIPLTASDRNHSALYYLVSSAPLLLWPKSLDDGTFAYGGWLARAAGILFGLCLGASVWYVARRLYGNSGGYVALTLYCFSPGMIRASAGWFSQSEMGAAWGAFGATFTGIAVAHTLYAPREVVLWNWRRIVLLGIALAMAIGSQFSLAVLLPLVLSFLLYLAPERRGPALVIWAAACALALLLLLCSYSFRISIFGQALRHASFLAVTASALQMPRAYLYLAEQIMQACPALLVALPAALLVFAAWQRTRYFGNTAPLLVSALFLVLGVANPHYPGMGFRLIALPFLFLFIAGVAADALETRHRPFVFPALAGLLASYALWSILDLGRLKG